MAKSRVAARRRSAFALVLVGFVLVTTGVIARRVIGVRRAGEIRTLQRKRDALVGERIRLEGAIRDVSSRARLQPLAEQRLNMRIPKPEQQIFLPRPSAGEAARARHDSL
jgi:cell division protein FtsL